MYYNQKHAESKDVSDMDIPPELCLELLIAADYLDGTIMYMRMGTCTNDSSMKYWTIVCCHYNHSTSTVL